MYNQGGGYNNGGMNPQQQQGGGGMNNMGGGMGGRGMGMGMGGGRGMGMGGGRGGGMGGGRGGSDTLFVRVNDAVHPINENVLTKVFEPIAPLQSIQMLPPPGPNTAAAVVRFGSPQIATQAKNARDGREIYGGCCQMQISFSSWDANTQQQGGAGGGLLGGGNDNNMGGGGGRGGFNGGMMGGGRGGYNNNMGGAPGMMNPQQQQQGGGGMMNNMGAGGPPQQQQGGMMNNNNMGRGGYNNNMGGGYNYNGMMGRGGYNNNMGMGRGGGMMNNNMGGGNPMGMMGGMGGQQMMGMGFGGGGRGGGMMGGMGGMGRGGFMAGGQQQHQHQGPAVPNPYVSLAMLSESCSLLTLFNLLECWGAVLWIKRNMKNKKIVVVKMASNQEAAAVSMNLKNVPFYDMYLSGRTFPQFNERGDMEPKEEGDPANPDVENFNFMTRTHRPAAWRSKTPCTFCVALGNFSNPNIDEAAITSYLNEIGIGFQSVSKDANEAGVFNVVCNDVSNGAKLVALGQAKICKDEKSQTKFIEPPQGAEPISTNNSNNNNNNNNNASASSAPAQQQQQQQQQTEEQQAQEVAAATAEESGASAPAPAAETTTEATTGGEESQQQQ